MGWLARDVRHAFRGLWKNRGFAAVAIATLALGIGANTAVYSLTDRVLLRVLPVPHPDELVVLRLVGARSGHVWSDVDHGAQSFSYPFYKDLRDSGAPFSGVLARFAASASVAGDGRTEIAQAELVSANYFGMLGVTPAVGRLLDEKDEENATGRPVAVLGHAYWTTRFGAVPGVVGREIVVNGRSMTVVGVAPAGFDGVQSGIRPDLYVPITLKPVMTPNWNGLDNRADYWLQMIARMRPGVARVQAEAALQPVVSGILEQEIQANAEHLSAERRDRIRASKMTLLPGAQGRLVLQEDARPGLLFLSAVVGLVLLIACANVANLLVARAAARRREIAIRLALGARRLHLVRQVLVESLLLALAGGAAGLLVASWSIDFMSAMLPPDSGLAALSVTLDRRVLAFNFAIALLTGVLFGLLPALRSTRGDLLAEVKDQSAGGGTGAAQVRLRKGLVVAQITITMVVLTAAGLFTASLRRLKGIDVGMNVEQLLTFTVTPELNGYSPVQTTALVEELRRGLSALPGADAAGAAEMGVLTDNDASSNATIEGYTAAPEESIQLYKNWVTPGYFATVGIPLLAGRDFTEADAAASPKVAIINETLAAKYFAGRDPIGARFVFGAGKVVPDTTIVGLVRDSKQARIQEDTHTFVYLPCAQDPTLGGATFYVRSALPPSSLAASVRALVARRDSNLPVYGVKTLVEQRDESIYSERLLASLSITFGMLAALLAAIGLYGTMAYSVIRRTREIGVRVALGATPRDIRSLVLREAGVLSIAGLGIGLPLAFAFGRLVRSLLFGVEPGDPRLFASAGLALVMVMAAAALLPARRAARVDPLTALRTE